MEHVVQEFGSRELPPETEGITPHNAKMINIYPNPSVGSVTIEMPIDIYEGLSQITNTENQIIISTIVYDNEFQYDASNLLSGSYIISIISENELVASEAFIKI